MRKDKLGRAVSVGDVIVHSYGDDSRLRIDEITGETPGGDPRVQACSKFPKMNSWKSYVRAEFLKLDV